MRKTLWIKEIKARLYESRVSIFWTAIVSGTIIFLYKFLWFAPIHSANIKQVETDNPGISKVILDRMAELPPQLIQLHDSWLSQAIFWSHLYGVLLVLSIVASTLVASGASILGEKPRNIIGVIAAISVGLLNGMSPFKIHEDFIEAWRSVNVVKLQYLMGQADIKDLSKSISDTEIYLRKKRTLSEETDRNNDLNK